MPEPIIKRLNIREAITQEAGATRNLLPPEINWDRVVARTGTIEKWLRTQLRAGYSAGKERISAVRKVQGTRPVPVWGIGERIIYRALANCILGPDFQVDRSPDAYLNFIKAPARYSEQLQQRRKPRESRPGQLGRLKLFFFLDSEIEYVVKSDITAFYQYVDHEILGQELQIMGGDFDAISYLLELLREVQGRSYGLPQLLDPSDALSEVYIDRVERQLIRQGLAVWRFNDDFRIACRTYSETLSAIEKLDAAARASGLVTSESKTLTFRFDTYMLDSLNLTVESGADGVDLDDVESMVGDYTDDFSEDPDTAIKFIQRTQVDADGDDRIDLRRMTAENARLLRRALGSLSHTRNAGAIPDMLRLLIFVPALSPNIFKYLQAVHSAEPELVTSVIDSVIDETSMNQWQQQWALHILRDLELLDSDAPGNAAGRLSWAKKLRLSAPSDITVAYAVVALAKVRAITFDDLMQNFEASSLALLPWYAEAIRVYCEAAADDELDKRRAAIAKMSPLHTVLVAD
jgi:hypothetical protein